MGYYKHCAQHEINRHAINSAGAGVADDDPMWKAYDYTWDAISTSRPHTLEGMKAKARVVLAQSELVDGEYVPGKRSRPAMGLGSGSRYRHGECGGMSEHPDAELIALCAEHQARIDAVNNSVDPNGDAGTDDAYVRSTDAISAAKPQTLAGMVAKAHAAMAKAKTLDGDYNPDNTMGEIWAWDLVEDLLAREQVANA